MAQQKIESRREIRRIETMLNEELSDLFGVPHETPMLSRTYDIIRQGMVLIRITETFPSTNFSKNSDEDPLTASTDY